MKDLFKDIEYLATWEDILGGDFGGSENHRTEAIIMKETFEKMTWRIHFERKTRNVRINLLYNYPH